MQLGVRDVAKLFDVSEKTVYRWLKDGSLPAYKVNEQYRFHRAELLEWATSQGINLSAEIFGEPQGEAAAALPGLAAGLETGGIHYRIGCTDKESALRAVVQSMQLSQSVDREFLLKVLLAREALESTGIGDGIAIPHVRNPIVLHVAKPTVTLSFLERPIDFKAIDGRPVQCLFTLVSPTVRTHLRILSRLAFALRDPAFKAVVIGQGSREEILGEARRIDAGCDRKPAQDPASDSTGGD